MEGNETLKPSATEIIDNAKTHIREAFSRQQKSIDAAIAANTEKIAKHEKRIKELTSEIDSLNADNKALAAFKGGLLAAQQNVENQSPVKGSRHIHNGPASRLEVDPTNTQRTQSPFLHEGNINFSSPKE